MALSSLPATPWRPRLTSLPPRLTSLLQINACANNMYFVDPSRPKREWALIYGGIMVRGSGAGEEGRRARAEGGQQPSPSALLQSISLSLTHTHSLTHTYTHTPLHCPLHPPQVFTMIFFPRFNHFRLANVIGLVTVLVMAIYIIIVASEKGVDYEHAKL